VLASEAGRQPDFLVVFSTNSVRWKSTSTTPLANVVGSKGRPAKRAQCCGPHMPLTVVPHRVRFRRCPLASTRAVRWPKAPLGDVSPPMRDQAVGSGVTSGSRRGAWHLVKVFLSQNACSGNARLRDEPHLRRCDSGSAGAGDTVRSWLKRIFSCQ
jgi:hypothetical protein